MSTGNADLAQSLQAMLNGKAQPMNQNGGNSCGTPKNGGNAHKMMGGNKHQSAGKRKSRGKKCKGRKSRGRKSRRKL